MLKQEIYQITTWSFYIVKGTNDGVFRVAAYSTHSWKGKGHSVNQTIPLFLW